MLKTIISSSVDTKKSLKVFGNSNFLIAEAKLAFSQFRYAFTKALIFYHFDLEYYIQIKIDAFGYVLSGILSYLTPKSGQWYPVSFFLRKIILVEIKYKIHNQELLAIVEVFKTLHHYLENCKYKILVLTDYNNHCQFINTKNLSFRYV